jgi:hypothetical protein
MALEMVMAMAAVSSKAGKWRESKMAALSSSMGR